MIYLNKDQSTWIKIYYLFFKNCDCHNYATNFFFNALVLEQGSIYLQISRRKQKVYENWHCNFRFLCVFNVIMAKNELVLRFP